MKKRILALSLAAAMVVGALASCTATTEPAGSDATVEARDITLTLWGSEQDQDFLKEVSAAWGTEYAAANADVNSVTVNVQIKGEDNAKTDALNDISAAADVFGVATDHLGPLSDANAIYELPATIASDVKSIIGDNAVYQASVWEGKNYGLPYTDNTAAILYYDKSKLSEEDVKSLNTILEKANLGTGIGGGWHDGMWYLTAGELYTNGDTSINTMNNEDVTKLLTWVSGQLKSGKLIHFDGEDDEAAAMKDGAIAAVIAGAWAHEKFENAIGTENLGYAELPNVTVPDSNITDKHMNCWGGAKMNVINANSKEPEAALSLAQAIMSLDNQVKRFEMVRMAPASTSLLSNAAIAADSMIAAEVAQTNYSSPASTLLGNSNYWGELGGITEAIRNKTLADGDIQSKLDAAVEAMQAAVNG